MLVVVAPANAVTGGPEALHQLVHTANRLLPGSAAICYFPFDRPGSVPAPYQIYDTPVLDKRFVTADDVVVLPEIWPELAAQFESRCALWWLSVDNFGTHGQRRMDGVDLHLFQSVYAADHGHAAGMKGIMLTDYLNPDFVSGLGSVDLDLKDRCVVVNPAKGGPLIERFKDMHPHLEVRELRGLDRVGVRDLLVSSMVYVDFGHHPGRDRPPREAAMAKCVVFSTRKGAAGNRFDVPIPDWFKSDSVQVLGAAVEIVLESVERFRMNVDEQASYRSWVAEQEQVFQGEVAELLVWAGLL